MSEGYKFEWSHLGDVSIGRETLGNQMPVIVYRLFEYTMREALTTKLGEEAGNEMIREAGRIAGKNFYEHFLSEEKDLSGFISKLQKNLADLQIGILRIESVSENGEITLTVSEDLDCSGLPLMGEAVCYYDEGFIAGLLGGFFKKEYTAKEIDCWAKGDRVCRFEASIKED